MSNTGTGTIRLLFLSDTHLGFDLPFKPRIKRRRRGPDFFKMFEMALELAFRGEVDAVVHGGDILFRSKVPPQLVQMAFEPLQRLAENGVPVYVVPGNHERSAIPYRLWASHPNIHIFVRPKTFYLDVKGLQLALAGFPYVRDNIRQNLPRVLQETGWNNRTADARVLCLHHCIEGAQLLMGDRFYVFRHNADVIRAADFPPGFAAVLSGHIHRFQVLTRDLQGNSFPVPVFYPGSTERTSFVEKDEDKGYLTLDIQPGNSGGRVEHWQFHQLPARPMIRLETDASRMSANEMQLWIKGQLAVLPLDAVVSIRVRGKPSTQVLAVLGAAQIRTIVPETMNVSVSTPDIRV